MKKITRTGMVIMMITVMSICYGQKHKGTRGVGIEGGITDFGFFGGAKYQDYFTKTMCYQIGGMYEWSNLYSMKHNCVYANALIMNDFFDSRDKHTILLGAGGSWSLDNLDQTKELGSSFVRTSNNIGALAKVQYEYYASKRICLHIQGTFNYNFVTQFAPTKFWCGAGINYIIF